MAAKKPVVKKTAPKATAKAKPATKTEKKNTAAKPVKPAAAKSPVVKKAAKPAPPKKAAATKAASQASTAKKVTKVKKVETVKKTVKSEKAAVVKKEVKKVQAAPAQPVKSKAAAPKPVKKETVKEVVKPVPAPVVEKEKKAAPVAKPIVPKQPEPVKPKTVEKPKPTKLRYTREELNEFKKLILEKQSEAINNLQTIRDQMLDPSTGEYINENSPYSLHMAEQGTDAMEKEKNYFYAQREQKFLGYLEEALKRIEAGTYGLCKDCIDDPKMLCPTCPLIPKERLEAVPHSQQCVQLKKMQEKPRMMR